VAKIENEKLKLDQRTVDFVAPGEQQPEVDHALRQENSRTGSNTDEFWRDANNGGYFSYNMSTQGLIDLSLNVRYQFATIAGKKFEIYVDDQKLKVVDHTDDTGKPGFYHEEYLIPAEMLKSKQQVRIKFLSISGRDTAPVYRVRLVKNN